MTSRVLIVDDHGVNRTKLSLAVKALGQAVADGASALTVLRQCGFDLVLLDVVMPGMNGFEVLEALKSDASLRDIPVRGVNELVVRALKAQGTTLVVIAHRGSILKEMDKLLVLKEGEIAAFRPRARGASQLQDVTSFQTAAGLCHG